jgi:PilZ domain
MRPPQLARSLDRRQLPARRHLLKSGKVLLGKHPVPCTIRNLSETGACLQVQTTAGIPSKFEVVLEDQPARTCKIIWRNETKLGVKFIKQE